MKLVGLRSLLKAKKFRHMPCNCFVAGTEVETPEGTIPIEQVAPDDEVLTRPQHQPGEAVRTGKVSRVLCDFAPAILWVTLASGQTMGATPGHEVWTYENGWGSAGELRIGDSMADMDGQPIEIVDVFLDPTPTEVYNLEVDGTFTYFVHGVWVHNNSCHIPGRGSWETVNEAMSARARAYQRQITGRSGEAFVVGGVKFDGISDTGVLLDAKGLGYANFVENGRFKGWFTGGEDIVDRANRQLGAAGGAPIEWHVAEPEAVSAFYNLFAEKGIQGIDIVYTPAIR